MSMTKEQLTDAVSYIRENGSEREVRLLDLALRDSSDLKAMELTAVSVNAVALVSHLRVTTKLRKLLSRAYSVLEDDSKLSDKDFDGLMLAIENALSK